MLKFEENLASRVSGALQPMLGVQVTVTAANGLLATLYADDESTVLGNPLETDTNGYFGFKAANGEYTLTFAGAQIEATVRKIQLYDEDDDPPLTLAQAAVPTAAGRIGFQASGTGALPRTVENKLGEIASVRDFGALGDGATNDSDAVSAARAAAGANRPIVLPFGDFKASQTGNFYGTNNAFSDGLRETILLGTKTAPATRKEAIVKIEKVWSAEYEGGFDQGAAYWSSEKIGGTTYGAATTSYARYTGGSGDLVAHHARIRLNSAQSQGFAGWFYTDVNTALVNRAIGIEININNKGIAPQWIEESSGDPSGIGGLTGIVCGAADGPYGIHQGIRFPNRPDGDERKMWTGIQFGQNVIYPSDDSGNGEAIRIRGASGISLSYGGLVLGDSIGAHHFTFGIRLKDATIKNNAAIWLAKNHRIVFGPSSGSGTYLAWTDLDQLNIQGGRLSIAGIQVVRDRRTGWAASTGTATRTAFATSTVTTAALAERVKALVDDLISHGLIGA